MTTLEQKPIDITKAEITAYADIIPNRYSRSSLLSRMGKVASDPSSPLFRDVDPYETTEISDSDDEDAILQKALAFFPESNNQTITEVYNPAKFTQFLSSEAGKSLTKEYTDLVNNYDRFRDILAPHRNQIDTAPTQALRSVEITDPNTGASLLATSTRLEDNDWGAGTSEHYISDSATAKYISPALKAADIPGVAKIVAVSYTDAVVVSERPAGTDVVKLQAEDIDTISILQIENYLLTLKALEEAGLQPHRHRGIGYYDRTEGFSIQFVEPKDTPPLFEERSPMSKALAPTMHNLVTRVGGATVSYEEAEANPELRRPYLLARQHLLDKYVVAITNILAESPEVLKEIASTVKHEKRMIQFALDEIDNAEK